METKVCSKCKVVKDFCEFNNRSRAKDGKNSSCKECTKEYYIKNREKQIFQKKEYYIKDREKIVSKKKEYYIKEREKILSNNKKYYIKNREKVKLQTNEYRIKNKENLRYYNNEYKKNRKLDDPTFKLVQTVRVRLYAYLKTKSIVKNKRTFDIIGCTPLELKEHLEKQFVDKMSWDNYSFNGWHIDHIIPLSSAKTEEEIYELCHYTNLQPLWAKDNFAKSNKLDYLYKIDKPKI
jgi:hypothetical protein